MSTSAPRSTWLPFATHRDLYLLVAGAVLGLVMGPAVLGQMAPAVYDRLFVGGGELAHELAEQEASLREELERIGASGVTQIAVQEHEQQRMREMLPLRMELATQQAEREGAIAGWMLALVVATVLVMVIESLVSPQPSTTAGGTRRAVVPLAVSRLITARYALLAVWLALALARPMMLANLPGVFTVLLVVVAVAAAFVPLGPRKDEPLNAEEHGWQ